MKTLLTWLGNKDIENIENDLHAAISALAAKSDIQFNKIVILSNHKPEVWDRFERFVQKKIALALRPDADVSVQQAHIASPIDYQSIAKESEKWIGKLSAEAETLVVNLTSGTPTMTTLSESPLIS